jgi:hypothetical protein
MTTGHVNTPEDADAGAEMPAKTRPIVALAPSKPKDPNGPGPSRRKRCQPGAVYVGGGALAEHTEESPRPTST